MKRAGAAEASFDKTTWIAIVILKGRDKFGVHGYYGIGIFFSWIIKGQIGINVSIIWIFVCSRVYRIITSFVSRLSPHHTFTTSSQH